MKKIKFYLLFVVSVLSGFNCSRSNHGESSVISEFKNSEAIQHAYYCYPSTLRMINLDDNAQVNAIVKDIRRLTLFNIWPQDFTLDDYFAISEKLQQQDGFTILAELDDQQQSLQLLGRNDGTETVALIHSKELTGLAHLLGSVNFLELLNLYNAIKEGDDESLSGIKNFFDVMTRDENNATQRRESQRRWEERRAKEQAERDSLERVNAVVEPE